MFNFAAQSVVISSFSKLSYFLTINYCLGLELHASHNKSQSERKPSQNILITAVVDGLFKDFLAMFCAIWDITT